MSQGGRSKSWTYCVQGFSDSAADGFKCLSARGHVQRMFRLTRGRRRYSLMRTGTSTSPHVCPSAGEAGRYFASVLSLMYPPEQNPGYSREPLMLVYRASTTAGKRLVLTAPYRWPTRARAAAPPPDPLTDAVSAAARKIQRLRKWSSARLDSRAVTRHDLRIARTESLRTVLFRTS